MHRRANRIEGARQQFVVGVQEQQIVAAAQAQPGRREAALAQPARWRQAGEQQLAGARLLLTQQVRRRQRDRVDAGKGNPVFVQQRHDPARPFAIGQGREQQLFLAILPRHGPGVPAVIVRPGLLQLAREERFPVRPTQFRNRFQAEAFARQIDKQVNSQAFPAAQLPQCRQAGLVARKAGLLHGLASVRRVDGHPGRIEQDDQGAHLHRRLPMVSKIGPSTEAMIQASASPSVTVSTGSIMAWTLAIDSRMSRS